MIHLYTGDGKGKSTAACGLCVRMVGSGKEAALIQFLKSGTSSELTALRKQPGMRVFSLEKQYDFFYNLTNTQKEQLKRETEAELLLAEKLLQSGQVALLVLDEVVDAVNLGLLQLPELCILLRSAGEVEVVLTGRQPPEELLELADYHTDFRALKHPYERGITARRGIEY